MLEGDWLRNVLEWTGQFTCDFNIKIQMYATSFRILSTQVERQIWPTIIQESRRNIDLF